MTKLLVGEDVTTDVIPFVISKPVSLPTKKSIRPYSSKPRKSVDNVEIANQRSRSISPIVVVVPGELIMLSPSRPDLQALHARYS